MPDEAPHDDLQVLASRVTAAQGEGLFTTLAQYLSTLLRASEVLIGEAVDDLHARTLGVCLHGAPQPNYSFPLAGTPCEALVRSDLAATGSSDGGGGDSGYLGLSLHGGDGRVIGFVCARSDGELQPSERQQCLIGIVSVLLTTELQLTRCERERAALEAEAQSLRSRLDALERGEVAAAASGVHRAPGSTPPIDLDDTEATGLHHVQREHILRVLNATRWVIEGNSGAALKLGMKPATLRHRMKKLGIARLRPQP